MHLVHRSPMMLKLRIIVAVVLAVLPVYGEDVFVQVQQGRLKGTTTTVGGKRVETYLGIPYAQPPVGDLRFTRPSTASAWTGDRDATAVGAECPQPGPGLTAKEDCLFLNVYTSATDKAPASLPVVAYIHGGSFVVGKGNELDPSLLTKNDIIMVTINYRLGALGFMSMGDSSAPGNFGMMDQVMALQWVKDNIASFGGNPSDVTLMGFSAGSVSTSLHRVSPLSRGLFHKLVQHSGSSLAPWAAASSNDDTSPRDIAMTLAGKVNCNGSSVSETVVKCLRGVSVANLLEAANTVGNSPRRFSWSPVIETLYNFLPEAPRKTLERGGAANVPAIIGLSKDEWANAVGELPDSDNGVSASTFVDEINKFATGNYPNIVTAATYAIKTVYLDSIDSTDPIAVRTGYVRLLSDFLFIAPIILEVDLSSQADRQPVYVYQLSHRPDNMNTPTWRGVTHFAGLYLYSFGIPILDEGQFSEQWNWKWSDSDKALTNDVIDMITNFIKTGNPTPAPVKGVTWTRYSPQGQSYLNIDLQPEMRSKLRPDDMRLWAETMPLIQKLSSAASGLHTGSGSLIQAIVLGLACLYAVRRS